MDRIPRCPKCRSLPNECREVWSGHGLSFSSDETGKPEPEGYLVEGSPTHVIASCGKCGWGWRIRGVVQITEVLEAFEKQVEKAGGEE